MIPTLGGFIRVAVEPVTICRVDVAPAMFCLVVMSLAYSVRVTVGERNN